MKVLLATIPYQNAFRSVASAYLKSFAEQDPIIRSRTQISILHLWRTGSPEGDAHHHLQMLWDEKPDVIGFSCYIWNIDETLDLCACIKRLAPKTRIILGGPQVITLGEAILAQYDCVDVIVPGEGEGVFSDLLRYFLGTCVHDLEEIEGIIFRNGDSVVNTGSRPPITAMDSIPSPVATGDIDLDDIRVYSAWMLYETSRGCPFHCSYCNFAGQANGVRNFPVDRVAKDLSLIFDKRVKSLWFIDPILNVNRNRTKQILRLIAAQNICTEISLFFQLEWIDDEIVELLADIKRTSPRLTLATGVQSTNPEALRLANRQWEDFERKREVVARLHGLGLLEGNLYWTAEAIYGLPGDDYQKFKTTVSHCIGLNPSQLELFPLHVLVGTDFYEQKEVLNFVLHPKTGRVLSSGSFSYEDMRLADSFATSALALYNAFTSAVLNAMAEALGCDLIGFFEKFGQYLATHTVPRPQRQPRLRRLLPDAQPEDFLKGRTVNGLDQSDIFYHLVGFIKQAFDSNQGESFEGKLIDLVRWEYLMSLVLWRATPVGLSQVPDNPLAILSRYPRLSSRLRIATFEFDPSQLLEGALSISEMQRQPATYLFIYEPRDTVNALAITTGDADIIRACTGEHSVKEVLELNKSSGNGHANAAPSTDIRLFSLILTLAKGGGLDLLAVRGIESRVTDNSPERGRCHV